MKMKYFQAIAQIRDHYNHIMRYMDCEVFGQSLLETWGIKLSDRPQIEEEREALRYLIGCQMMITHDDNNHNAQKPSAEVVTRCLERHLTFLETVHHCHAHNVNKHSSKFIQKQYKACRYYIFKFSYPLWVGRLPDEILTFENKYPNFKSKIL